MAAASRLKPSWREQSSSGGMSGVAKYQVRRASSRSASALASAPAR